MADRRKNPLNDPEMVLSDTGLHEYVQSTAAIFVDVAHKLEAAQQVLYQGLMNAGKGERQARLIAWPLGQAADNLMTAKRMVERTWRLAKLMIRGIGKAQGMRGRTFQIGGRVDDDG